MVAPVREVANKQFSNSSANTFHSTMAQFPSNMDMDVDCDEIIRGRPVLPGKANSRSSSISSSTSSIPYHECMEINNNIPDVDIREPINSSQLSYKDNTEKDESVSKVADTIPLARKQCVSNEAPALKTAPKPGGRGVSNNNSNSSPQETFNIQLLYDINRATDQDAWDGEFCSISLHGLIEHISSDIKNIKTSLCQMTNYILNKKVERGKVNDFEDLKGIGNVARNFISAIYKSG